MTSKFHFQRSVEVELSDKEMEQVAIRYIENYLRDNDVFIKNGEKFYWEDDRYGSSSKVSFGKATKWDLVLSEFIEMWTAKRKESSK